MQCAVVSHSRADCFQEKWEKHLLKVRIQTPPHLAVHSECVFVFSLGFWSCLIRHVSVPMSMQICAFDRGEGVDIGLLLSYVIVQ